MSTNHHTAIPASPKQAANAATINAPLAELDAAITTNAASVDTVDGRVDTVAGEVTTARSGYLSLDARIDALIISDGVANAEVTSARAGESLLEDRLEKFDQATGLNILRNTYGGTGDGTTNDWLAYQTARTAAGADGVVLLPTDKTYRIAVDRPNLSGTYVQAGPDAAISVIEENPNTQAMKLLTPLTVSSDDHATTRTHPANVNLPWMLHNIGAAAAAAISGENVMQALSFTADMANFHINASNAITASGATVTATAVTWASTFANEEWEGVRMPATPGRYYEVTFDLSGAHNGGNINAFVQTSGARVDMRLTVGAAEFREYTYPGGTLGATITTPNGGAYSLAANGGVTLGLRLLDRYTVEVYINHFLIHTKTLSNVIQYVGWTTNDNNATALTLKYPIMYTKFAPSSTKPLAIAVEGDSIAYGAWASITWPQMLQAIASNLPGVGALTVTNNGISGQASGALATRVALQDYSSYDYVLVMVGSNDCQGGVLAGTLASNLTTIGNAIVEDGSVPIFGTPPMYTQASISGVTGVTTTNYARMGKYSSSIRRVCATNGWGCAEVQGAFGTNYLGWYGDNIHPNETGAVAVASAFARALWQAEKPAVATTIPTYSWTAVASFGSTWTNFGGVQSTAAYLRDQEGFVHLKGTLKNGTPGSGTTVFTLPSGYRPSQELRFPAITVGSSTHALGAFRVLTTGVLEILAGGTDLFSLDGCTFYADGS